MKLLFSVHHQVQTTLHRLSGWVLLGIRISLGLVFVQSGWAKFQNLDRVIQFFQDLQIPFAELQAPFVAGVEIFAGFLVLGGIFTPLAALPLIVIMVVAILTAKMEEVQSLTDLLSFSEFGFVLLLLILATFGPGPFSFDSRKKKRA